MKFEKDYTINYYLLDRNKKASIISILRLFEDSAISQSTEAGVSFEYYEKHRCVWVLYKWDLTINRYPEYLEKVKVITRPWSFHRIYAYRYFELIDETGDIVAWANTIWFFIDTEKGRPTTITEDMYTAFGLTADDKEHLEITDPIPLEKITTEMEFSIRKTDIDTNGHVNNIKYVEWVLETVPADVFNNKELSNLRIIYKNECEYEFGKTVKSLLGGKNTATENIYSHKIVNGETDLCHLESRWV